MKNLIRSDLFVDIIFGLSVFFYGLTFVNFSYFEDASNRLAESYRVGRYYDEDEWRLHKIAGCLFLDNKIRSIYHASNDFLIGVDDANFLYSYLRTPKIFNGLNDKPTFGALDFYFEEFVLISAGAGPISFSDVMGRCFNRAV